MAINYLFSNEILNYIGSDNKSNWYVGIATYPRDRLFRDHCVDERNGQWIYNTNPMSETDARDTEKYLLETYPFQGDVGGGIYPTYVYAYKITSYTRE